MKTCPRCGERFAVSTHAEYCRSCWNSYQRERYRKLNPDPNPDNTATRKKCPDCGVVKPRKPEFGKSGRAPYCKPCTKVRNAAAGNRNGPYDAQRRREENLRIMGLTVAEYDAMLDRQGGGCAICGGVNESGRRLTVDHDHSCCGPKRACGNCVRGLLCFNCNIGIGKLRDDPELLSRAADYLALPRLMEVI